MAVTDSHTESALLMPAEYQSLATHPVVQVMCLLLTLHHENSTPFGLRSSSMRVSCMGFGF